MSNQFLKLKIRENLTDSEQFEHEDVNVAAIIRGQTKSNTSLRVGVISTANFVHQNGEQMSLERRTRVSQCSSERLFIVRLFRRTVVCYQLEKLEFR